MSETQAKPEPLTKTALTEVGMATSGGGGAMLMPQNMADVVNFSQMMAKGGIALPKHLRDQPGACLGVAMQAFRWDMDPFAVANKSYSVNDRLAYEAQLVAAVVHLRAPIVGRPEYTYEGDRGSTRRCTVTCVMQDGSERSYTSPEVGSITTKNSPLWKQDEDQQLGYYSIRSWARRYAPEVILGVYTPDEAEQFRDITPRKAGIAERLPGAQPAKDGGKGFSRANVEAQTGGATEAEVVDAEYTEVEAPENPAQETAPDAAAPDLKPEAEAAPSAPESGPGDDFPGDRPSKTFSDDPKGWSTEKMAEANAFRDQTKEALRAWWTRVSGTAEFMQLRKDDPKAAEDLKAHVQKIDRELK